MKTFAEKRLLVSFKYKSINFRTFWLSWQDGIIKLGKSALIGEALLIEHAPASSYNFAGISFASASGNYAEFYIVSSQS